MNNSASHNNYSRNIGLNGILTLNTKYTSIEKEKYGIKEEIKLSQRNIVLIYIIIYIISYCLK